MIELLWQGLWETCLMVGLSSLISIVGGLALGVLLFSFAPHGLVPKLWLYRLLSIGVNVVRSIPYIILTVLMIPTTRLVMGTSIGTMAAVVPLSVAGLLLVARSVEDALHAVPVGLVEVGKSCGAKRRDIILKILLPEALPQIVASSTLVVINLIGFSAMAGAVGGGGLGDLAIRYGYQRYDLTLLVFLVSLLILMVQLVQSVGDGILRRIRK